MKKFFILCLILLAIFMITGCQKGEEQNTTVNNTPAATETKVAEATPKAVETAPSVQKTLVETWTGGGDGQYDQVVLAEFPPTINWQVNIKDVKMEVYSDNTVNLKGKVVFAEQKVTDVNISEEEKMEFFWDKPEYDFNIPGKKENDKYILNKVNVIAKMKSHGVSLNSSEYDIPVIYSSKNVEGTPTGNGLIFSGEEKGTSSKGITKITGNFAIELTKE